MLLIECGGVDSANSAPDIPELDPILWKKDFSCGWRLTLRLLRRCCKDQPCESEGRRLAVWILKINPTVFFHSTCFIVLFTKENDTSTLKLMNSLYHTNLVNFPHTRGADETVTKGRKSVESRNKDTKKNASRVLYFPGGTNGGVQHALSRSNHVQTIIPNRQSGLWYIKP